MLLDVEAELRVELAFQGRLPPDAAPPCHSAPASDSRRIPASASLRRRQLAVCVSSCVLPFRVSRQHVASRPLSVCFHSAASRPRFSRRWSAGYNEPCGTCTTSRETCCSRCATLYPCTGPRATTFRISRSSVPCGRSDLASATIPPASIYHM